MDTCWADGSADGVPPKAKRFDVAGESLEPQRSFDAGKSNLPLPGASQLAYQEAWIGYVQTKRQRLNDSARLSVALGGGWWHDDR